MSLLSKHLPLATLLATTAASQDAGWTVAASCPEANFEAPALVIDDQLYIFGGWKSMDTQATHRVQVYDPVSDTWSSASDLPTLATHIGVALDGRTVWLAGGFVGHHPGVATAATWTYDVDLDLWSSAPPMPKALAAGALVRFDRNLHWFGGVEADRETNSGDHFVLDLDDPGAGWASLAPMPDPRNHHAGARLGDKLHAIGGQQGHDTVPVDTDHHHAYDPSTDTWTAVAPLPFPRSHFEGGTLVDRGMAIIVSGRSSTLGEDSLVDVTQYDPAADEWSAMPPLPNPRVGAVAKVIRGRLITACGASGSLAPTAETYSRPADFSFDGHMRVNCGGPHYVDTLGRDWISDVGHREGGTFENTQVVDVVGTVEDGLYLTHRTADAVSPELMDYRIPADPGKYRLLLHFAEIFHGATGYGGPSIGQRILRVTIEGEGVRAGIDVADMVGVETATTLTFDFEVADAAADLRVIATTGTPMLAAYELITLPDDAFATYCSSGPNSSGAPGLMSFRGSSSLSGADLRLGASPLPNGQFGLFFYSQAETDVAFGNGRRCVDHPIHRLAVHQITDYDLTHKLDFDQLSGSGEILAGSTWSFQAWFRDPPGGGAKFDTSNALRMNFTN